MDDDDCEDLEIWEDVQEEFHGFDSVQKIVTWVAEIGAPVSNECTAAGRCICGLCICVTLGWGLTSSLLCLVMRFTG